MHMRFRDDAAGCRHLLVSCEDPDADASSGQALNALGDAILQLVLNGRAAQ